MLPITKYSALDLDAFTTGAFNAALPILLSVRQYAENNHQNQLGSHTGV